MANRIKGITIELMADNSKLAEALKKTKTQLVETSNELKSVNKLLKLDPGNITILSQKQELLSKQIEQTKERLKQLNQLQEQFGDTSKLTDEQKEQYRLLEREIAQCENQLKGYYSQQEDVNKAIDDVNKGEPFEDLSNDIEKTGKSALKTGDIIKANIISDVIINGVKKLASSLKGLVSSFEEWSQMSNALKEQEAKVAQVMKNTTGATDAQIQSLIDLTAKQEKLGVVSQETQLAGLQELGTYVEQRKSLEKLLPVMNDMIAQQYGIGASMESASGIATMMGKVLGNGQVDALSRLGYKFNDTQKKVLKFGTEQQKVNMLTKIITQSVGGMNQALAQTDAGKMEIARSKMDDLKKSVGETYTNIKNKLVSTIANHLLPTLEKSANAIKKWADSVDWNKVGNEIKKALDKVIDAFKWIINNAQTIIKVVGTIISAFAVAKIVEFGQKCISVISGIYDACKVLFALIAAHPIMAIATAVGALATAYLLLKDNTDPAITAERQHREELEKEYSAVMQVKDAMSELKDAKQKQINAGMTEMSYYQGLNDELKTLFDRNGKVKKGYEERASFIIDTLSNALGIEINHNKSLNSQYQQLEKNIQKVMDKKKAQIILNAQEELYAEAIKNEQEANLKLADAQQKLNEEKQRYNDLGEKMNENLKKYQETGDATYFNEAKNQAKLREEMQNSLITADATYREQLRIVQEYAYNKSVYEKNLELSHKGLYDKMITVSWEYVKEYESVENAEQKIAEDKLRADQERLVALYQMRNDSNAKIIDSEIKKQKKLVEEDLKGLKQYNYDTEEQLYYNAQMWDGSMDALVSDLTRQNVRFFKTADGNVQMYVNGIKEGTPKTEKEMKELISKSVSELTKGTKYEEAGKDIVNGVTNGINIKKGDAYKAISSFGSNLLAKLKLSLKEQSPSKATAEMGTFLDEGLINGIKAKQKEVEKVSTSLGNSVLDSINSSMDVNGVVSNYENAMSGLSKGVEASLNPTINPTANSNPLYITIDKFYNNRETDVRQLAEELEFYRKNSALAKGGA